jgi:hypothetical protein
MRRQNTSMQLILGVCLNILEVRKPTFWPTTSNAETKSFKRAALPRSVERKAKAQNTRKGILVDYIMINLFPTLLKDPNRLQFSLKRS